MNGIALKEDRMTALGDPIDGHQRVSQRRFINCFVELKFACASGDDDRAGSRCLDGSSGRCGGKLSGLGRV